MGNNTKMNSPIINPSVKVLKKMGLIKDQDGIMKRYLNERGNWNTHLKNTREFITDRLIVSGAKSVSVLGSGWMLDIPQGFLADNFDTVFFYDLRHPRPLKHRYRKQKNFRFIEIDLMGGILEKAYRIGTSKTKIDLDTLEEELSIPSFKLPVDTDYFVSVNILNQLDILVIDYLKSRVNLPDAVADILRKKIQQNHLDILPHNRSLLVTDFEEISIDTNGNKTKVKSLIYVSIPEDKIQKRWIWQFDTRMTYRQDCNTSFNVIAATL
jgi:hypothetical protein